MKRHEVLVPLSRDHHDALILAQLLKMNAPDYDGLPSEIDKKAIYAKDKFVKDLVSHFESEEKMFAVVNPCHPDIKKQADEIVSEHQQLRKYFLSLDPSATTVQDMDVIGRMLEAHIRKEERVLFPLIQQHCPEEILRKIEL